VVGHPQTIIAVHCFFVRELAGRPLRIGSRGSKANHGLANVAYGL
jgi:hypothetical protein